MHVCTPAQVRIAAAQQLPALSRALGEEGTKRHLLEELGQLLDDEEAQVGCTHGADSTAAAWAVPAAGDQY